MMKPVWIGVAAGVVAVGIMVATFGLRGQQGTPVVPVADPKELQVPVTSQGGSKPSASQGNSYDTAAMRIDPVALEQAGIREAAESTRKFEAIFSADKANPVKDAETEQALSATIVSPAVLEIRAQPLDHQVSCRASMCRVETNFISSDESLEWVNRVVLQTGNNFGNFSTVMSPGKDGQKKVVIYAFRPGQQPKT